MGKSAQKVKVESGETLRVIQCLDQFNCGSDQSCYEEQVALYHQ